ncbi:hypothetical protein V2J09_016143 [Rumex salicifolius]
MLSVRLTSTATMRSNRRNPPGQRRLAGARTSVGVTSQGSSWSTCVVVRAVISSGDRAAESPATAAVKKAAEVNGHAGGAPVTAAVFIRNKRKESLSDKVEGLHRCFTNALGHGILLQLISEEIDPVAKPLRDKGRKKCAIRCMGVDTNFNGAPARCQVQCEFYNPQLDFGKPGAILVTNHYNTLEIVLHLHGRRIAFRNQVRNQDSFKFYRA